MSRMWTLDCIFAGKYPVKTYKITKADIMGMRNHAHEYVQLWYVVKGTCRHLVDNIVYEMKRGYMLILPPNAIHNFECDDEELEILACDFMLELVTDSLQENIGENGYKLIRFVYLEAFISSLKKVTPCLIFEGVQRMEIEERLTKMLQIYSKEERFYEIELKAELLGLLVCIARGYDKMGKKEEKSLYKKAIQSCIAYVEEHYDEKFTVLKMAKYCAMSESYFTFFFKEVTGVSFIHYLNTYRIKKSKTLLIETDMSLEKIAEKIGFSDATYYARVFKKIEKITPQQYRNDKKEVNETEERQI